MEPFENEELQQQPLQQEHSIPTEESQPEQEQLREDPQSGFYHGVGAGQKEAPFVSSPYATYHPYEPVQPIYQQPVQPQSEQKPGKENKHYGKKIFRGITAVIFAVVLVVASCGITAVVSGIYWNQKFGVLTDYLDEKVDALQGQIEDLEDKTGGNGGNLETSGETLTAGQIYQQNVNSVVALTCTTLSSANGTNYTSASAGTGFVLTQDGYIVTNHHVVEGANTIIVTMADGAEYAASLIGSDATNDVALIKVDAIGLDPVTIGSSSDMKVGDQVVAIGNALGELSSSLTVGYVSGMDRDVTTDGSIINMLQTDVAINSGNSGGPLFNARGEVIGITTAKYSGTTSSGASIEGISFAIPIDDVLGLLEDLQNYGYIRSPFLGVMASDVDPEAASYYGFPVGAYIASVTPGYCAAEAGIQVKDIIVELGGYEVSSMNDLGRTLRKFEAGDTVTVKVWRSGQELLLQVTLDEKPRS